MPLPTESVPRHPEEIPVPRWIHVLAGLGLAVVLLLCLGGSLAMVFPTGKAPIGERALGAGMVLVTFWGFLVCYRLVTGKRVRGGLVGPFALRVCAWLFLLAPIGGLFTGYFVTNTFQALVETAAYVSVFFGLRSLATHRERNDV